MSRYEHIPFETEAPLFDDEEPNDNEHNIQLLHGAAAASDNDDDNDNDNDEPTTPAGVDDVNRSTASNDNDSADVPLASIARAAESSFGPAAAAASPAAVPATSPPHYPVFSLRDGVFSNLHPPSSSSSSSSPTTTTDPSKPAFTAEPPSYIENLSTPPPAYYEPTTVVATSGLGDDGEVLIEGLPVGDLGSFMGHALFSIVFDFIGYGAFMLRDPADDPYGPWDDNNDDYNNRARADNAKWLSAIFIVIGSFMIIRSLIDLLYVSRLEKVIKSSSAAEPTPV
ncbi:hypothetical protein HDU87_000378 [Geranomyces variabilis]|uniref:Uncharacterized protein n=1 Tax=Geranomyces variabilis TaxID=109894 RepID=A0AAD5TQQ9_9FUNG|nr:hypothetical protein HDU87_000378 [Geranomyces variabilis]